MSSKRICHIGRTHAVANSSIVVLLAWTKLSCGIQDSQQSLGCLFIVTLMRTNKNNTETIQLKRAKWTGHCGWRIDSSYIQTQIFVWYILWWHFTVVALCRKALYAVTSPGTLSDIFPPPQLVHLACEALLCLLITFYALLISFD